MNKKVLLAVSLTAMMALTGCVNRPSHSETNPSVPSETSSEQPSENPSEEPSENPSEQPSENPSEEPSENPSEEPSENPSEEPSENPSESSEEEMAVTIKYVNQHGKNYIPTMNKIIEKFQAAHPNITVQSVQLGGYDTIHTQTVSDIAAATGEYGDIVLCYPDHVVDYIDYGVAVQLDDLMHDPVIGWSEEEEEDMIPGFLEEGRQYPIEGTYSVPFCKSTEGLFYNATTLVGLDLSEIDATINGGNALTSTYFDNLTWEEFFGKLCPALDYYNKNVQSIITDGGEGTLTGICGYDSIDNLFINLCEQYGCGYTSVNSKTGKASLDFDNAKVRELMKTFNDAAKKGYLVPSTKIANNSYCSSFFTANNLLFNIGSTAGVGHEVSSTFDVNVTNIPGAADGNQHVISQGPSLCILAHPEEGVAKRDARIKAAWQFYDFLTNTDNSSLWAMTVGYLPVRSSSLETEAYLEYADTTGKPAKSLELLTAKNAQYSTAASNNVFTSPVFKGSSTARTQVGAMLSKALLDDNLTDAEIDTLIADTINAIRLDMES